MPNPFSCHALLCIRDAAMGSNYCEKHQKMTAPTPNRPADDRTLDEILENIAASTGFYADDIFTVIHPEAKAALLRWRAAGVRAVLERLKATGDGYVVWNKDIDAELDKLKYDQD